MQHSSKNPPLEDSADESSSSSSDDEGPPILIAEKPNANDGKHEDSPMLESDEEGESSAEVDLHNCAKCHQSTNNNDKKAAVSAGGYKKGDKKEDDWIQCDGCTLWYHLACVDVEEFESKLIDKYHCKGCEEKLGKTIWKEIKVPHRYEFWNEDEKNKPTQVGTKPWIDEFIKKEKDFPLFEALKLYKNGYQFMADFDQDKEWIQPLKILDPEGLEMKLPEVGKFDMDELLRIVGGDEAINTIDVYMQQSSMMTMKKFFGRWMDEPRIRLFNMLSFEFSHTPLMDIVRAPALMYKLSWVHKLWPLSINGQAETSSNENKPAVFLAEHLELKPDVAMFCLLGMAGSYTDFHIDFGGSSVWYHVYSGQKIFYVIEPTKENLEAFTEWTNGPHRSEQFLNDLIPSKPMKKVVIEQGETLMIPSGWIHAVYTPVDSIVFGGNFIHELNIKKQLEVYDVELKCNYDENFLYPQFELVNWYAALEVLDRFNSTQSPSPAVVEGFRALLIKLGEWSAREKRKDPTWYPHNIFRDVIPELKRLLLAYDAENEKDGAYDPENENKNKGLLKIKIKPNAMDSGKLKRKSKDDKFNERKERLPKKDAKYVANMFQSNTSSGRVPKPSKWVTDSVGIECQPGPSSGNKNFMKSFSIEKQKEIQRAEKADNHYAKMNGDNDVSSDDDDLLGTPKKKPKLSKPKEAKSPKPKPAKVQSIQQRMFAKMKLNQRKSKR